MKMRSSNEKKLLCSAACTDEGVLTTHGPKISNHFNYVDIPSGNAPKDHIKSIKCERHKEKTNIVFNELQFHTFRYKFMNFLF